MPEGVILHREKPPVSGTWSPRPPALAGITPKAVLVFGNAETNEIDGVTSANASFFAGVSNGAQSRGIANYQADGTASSSVIVNNAGNLLVYALRSSYAALFRLGWCTLVSGGMDVPVVNNVSSPYVVCVFFYGDDWQAYCGPVRISNVVDGVVTVPTGFTGTNENQIVFTLPCMGDQCTNTFAETNAAVNFGMGIAARQGASTVPMGQVGWSGGPRNNWSTSTLGQMCQSGRIHTPATYGGVLNTVECTRIADNEVDFTTRDSTTRRGFITLILSTGTKRCWAGKLNAPIVSGDWVVSDPGFFPGAVGIGVSQHQLDGVSEFADIAIGGAMVGTPSDEFSSVWSDQDAAATMVAKSRINSQFLDVLQDNGTDGWKSGPSDFSLTSSGFRVDNVVVSPGAPTSQRFWMGWAIEGEAGGGQEYNLDTDDLSHEHPVDVINLIPSTYRMFGEDLSHAHNLDSAPVTKVVGLSPAGMTHNMLQNSTSLIIQIEAVLASEDLNHDHDLDPSYFGRYLRADGLDHGHALGQVTLTTTKGLLLDDLTHAHALDSVNVQSSPNFPLNVQGLSHDHPVDSVSLPKISTLLAQGLDHVHSIEIVDLRRGGETYPYFNANEGMLLFTWKTRYSKADIEVAQDTMALIGLQASADTIFRLFHDVVSALESLDGTSVARVNLDGGSGPREGIKYRCALWWDNGTQRRQIGYKPEDGDWVWGSETTYDGRFGEGALRVFFNNEYPQLISDIVIYNQNAGRAFIESLPLEF